jgi:hypothetical protein
LKIKYLLQVKRCCFCMRDAFMLHWLSLISNGFHWRAAARRDVICDMERLTPCSPAQRAVACRLAGKM